MLERLYSPLLLLALSVPLFMMGGVFQTSLAALAILSAGLILVRQNRKPSAS